MLLIIALLICIILAIRGYNSNNPVVTYIAIVIIFVIIIRLAIR